MKSIALTIKEPLVAIFMALTILAVAATAAVAGEGPSDRERIAVRGDVALLYAVDETHSFVIGTPDLEDLDTSKVVTVYGTGFGSSIAAVMVEHSEAQPLVWKNPQMPSYDEIGVPVQGRTSLGVEVLDSGKDGYTAIDLYQHSMISCDKSYGTASFVIPKEFGNYKRLTEVDAVEAFNYILLSGDDGGAWYMACEGGTEKFQVKKNYKFLTDDAESAEVRHGRALEGVDYARFGEAPVSMAVLARDAAYENNIDHDGFLEEMARQVASLRFHLVKAFKGDRYMGSVSSERGGCDEVTIKHLTKRAVERNNVAKVFEYKVCNDHVAKVSEREIDGGPDEGKTLFAASPVSYLASVND